MTDELELPPPTDRRELRRRLAADRRQRRREALDRRLQVYGRRLSDTAAWCYGAGVKTMQFPAYVFDLLDTHGRPDHTKIGPFLVSQELVALQAYDVVVNKRPLQAAVVVIIAVLSFASMSLMRKFLDKSSTSIVSETKIVDVAVREIQERRDESKGFEATP